MTKGTYVDGFVLVVPKKNVRRYTKMASDAAKVWKRFGALDYKECRNEDLKPNTGGMRIRAFTKMTKAKPGEDVWFSYIVYKNKKHRDAVNKKVMTYFTKKYPGQKMEMPFDTSKMAYGGFVVMAS